MAKIIGLVGEKFAGKDAVANYLAEKRGAFHVRFSHLLDEILNVLNLPISRRNEIDLGLGLRKIFGNGVLGKALVKRVKESPSELIVINGIRMDEMKDVKELGAKIIYVTAPIETRFERYNLRHDKVDDGKMNFDEFKEQEKEETERGIPKLGAEADFRIENTRSLDELYSKVDEILNKL